MMVGKRENAPESGFSILYCLSCLRDGYTYRLQIRYVWLIIASRSLQIKTIPERAWSESHGPILEFTPPEIH